MDRKYNFIQNWVGIGKGNNLTIMKENHYQVPVAEIE